MGRIYGNIDKEAVLLESVVTVVARVGIENASTRLIGQEAGFQDAFIYRYFESKDHLLAQAYREENEKLMNILIQVIDRENQMIDEKPLKDRSACVIQAAWKYLTDNPRICKYLVYYYNSPGFAKYALDDHKKWLDKLCDLLYPTFLDRDEAATLLYMIFNSVYGFAMQVANGELPNTNETAQRVFANVYTAISACYERTCQREKMQPTP